jgi:hypothetical protein
VVSAKGRDHSSLSFFSRSTFGETWPRPHPPGRRKYHPPRFFVFLLTMDVMLNTVGPRAPLSSSDGTARATGRLMIARPSQLYAVAITIANRGWAAQQQQQHLTFSFLFPHLGDILYFLSTWNSPHAQAKTNLELGIAGAPPPPPPPPSGAPDGTVCLGAINLNFICFATAKRLTRAALCVLSIHPAVINAESTFIFLALLLGPSRLQLQRQK